MFGATMDIKKTPVMTGRFPDVLAVTSGVLTGIIPENEKQVNTLVRASSHGRCTRSQMGRVRLYLEEVWRD